MGITCLFVCVVVLLVLVLLQVMYVSQHERQLMKTAMEMAVLTSIQHPNMVRVYACLTDLLEEAGKTGIGRTARDDHHQQLGFTCSHC